MKEIKCLFKAELGVGLIIFLNQILKQYDNNVGNFWLNWMVVCWFGYIVFSYFEEKDDE